MTPEPASAPNFLSKSLRTATSHPLVSLILIASLLYGLGLGQRDLWNPNEAIYGRAVVEMAESGDWLVPTVNGIVFAEKPILYYWMALTASKLVGGISEFSLRIPSAMAGIGSLLLIFFLAEPYIGRRRALLAAALLGTQYQVFWASRSVQMDVLVLFTTLGMLLPLSRMLDFERSPNWAWPRVGLVAGLGMLAKGPVTWVIPGLAFLTYCLVRRKSPQLWNRGFVLAVLLTLVIASTWYLPLILQGRWDVVHEVLVRQNFGRFHAAWDHQQPWWYYLEYFWIELSPWALLVPIAILSSAATREEARLQQLSWCWILPVLLFFSLSESKRAPYILPIAPAVAILAESVLYPLVARTLSVTQRRFTLAVLGFYALVLAVGAGLVLFEAPKRAPEVMVQTWVLAGIALLTASAIAVGVYRHRRLPALALTAMLVGLLTVYWTATSLLLPGLDARKSARSFCEHLNQEIEQTGATVASFDFWAWRAGYSFYAGRSIPNLATTDDLTDYWNRSSQPLVLVEDEGHLTLEMALPDAALVHDQKIGSRHVYLYGRGPSGP